MSVVWTRGSKPVVPEIEHEQRAEIRVPDALRVVRLVASLEQLMADLAKRFLDLRHTFTGFDCRVGHAFGLRARSLPEVVRREGLLRGEARAVPG
jgi:hypothetical protein